MERELDYEEMTDQELHGVVGGAGLVAAWSKIGPIVKPILYPTRIRSGGFAAGVGLSSATGCDGGVCR